MSRLFKEPLLSNLNRDELFDELSRRDDPLYNGIGTELKEMSEVLSDSQEENKHLHLKFESLENTIAYYESAIGEITTMTPAIMSQSYWDVEDLGLPTDDTHYLFVDSYKLVIPENIIDKVFSINLGTLGAKAYVKNSGEDTSIHVSCSLLIIPTIVRYDRQVTTEKALADATGIVINRLFEYINR